MYQGIIICLEEGKRRRSICLLYKEGSDLCDFCPPSQNNPNLLVTTDWFGFVVYLKQ